MRCHTSSRIFDDGRTGKSSTESKKEPGRALCGGWRVRLFSLEPLETGEHVPGDPCSHTIAAIC